MKTSRLALAWVATSALTLAGCPEIEKVEPDPAAPGAVVTLHGKDLGATPRPVFHDGEPIEVTSWSPSAIVAVLPDGKPPGEYEIAIGSPHGHASTTHSIDIPDMRYVPAGEFTMGGDLVFNEGPIHAVYLDAYWIDAYEVSNGDYVACHEAGACQREVSGAFGCNGPSVHGGFIGEPEEASNCHTWHTARAYCAWAGKRLPTEAEWEKAARGTDARTYPWGEEPPTCALAAMDDPAVGGPGCGTGEALLPGSRPDGASPYGVFDMAGNLAEYVADYYDPDYYSVSPYENPQGPAEPTFHNVLRGGSWLDWNPALLRTITRIPAQLGGTPLGPNFGFRCARDG